LAIEILKGDFRIWGGSFLRTYVDRDLPALGISADPVFMRRLLIMLAHGQGGIGNASSLGVALGVSHLVKRPKLYLRDTGLLHHLLNLGSLDEVANHPVEGASFETFVIEDLIRRESLVHPHTQFYFWRTSAAAEVDLVLDRGSTRIAVEIKCSRGGRPETIRQLRTAMVDLEAPSAWIIDEDQGSDPLGPKLHRRGLASDLGWLPP
jgi:uncharacterized protein